MKKILIFLFLISIFLGGKVYAAPVVTLNFPQNNGNFSYSITFNCSATSQPAGLSNITLYGNWSGRWESNGTNFVSGASNSTTFTRNLPQGRYLWNCLATDNLSQSNFSLSNRTINIDKTPPVISSFALNESYLCGTTSRVKANCSVTDSFTGVKSVVINVNGSGSNKNYSASFVSGNTYSASVPLNQTGLWNFTCIATDYSGNLAKKYSSIRVYSSLADLTVSKNDLSIFNQKIYEGENVTISAVIHNNGCQNANNFLEGFYYGNPSSGGINLGNVTLSVPQRSSSIANISWITSIGPANIFTIADLTGLVTESNKSNNEANRTFNIPAWQVFYGNVTATKILENSNSNEMNLWFNDSITTGMIFVTDKNSVIHWNSLVALGRSANGAIESNDFSDLDKIFNMTSFNDSVSNLFTTNGNTPKQTENFTVDSINTPYVPVIESTNTTNFMTGIMWDSYYDTDGQFDTVDKEKVVFATKVNQEAQGGYGKYDYEIKIPVRLRNQSAFDNSNVYFYYELS